MNLSCKCAAMNYGDTMSQFSKAPFKKARWRKSLLATIMLKLRRMSLVGVIRALHCSHCFSRA